MESSELKKTPQHPMDKIKSHSTTLHGGSTLLGFSLDQSLTQDSEYGLHTLLGDLAIAQSKPTIMERERRPCSGEGRERSGTVSDIP